MASTTPVGAYGRNGRSRPLAMATSANGFRGSRLELDDLAHVSAAAHRIERVFDVVQADPTVDQA